MLKYIDKRDDENLIITHIYLILGITYGLFKLFFNSNLKLNTITLFIG